VALIIIVLSIVVGVVGLYALFGLAKLLPHLLVAGVVGWLADLVVPGKLPYGFLGAIAAGVIGGFLGGLLLRGLGPELAGVQIVPTFVGAAALAFGLELYNQAQRGERF
jgi:uncharacterized membrane protein YeaQ/YmgE (transglycosylase-associated protein family)